MPKSGEVTEIGTLTEAAKVVDAALVKAYLTTKTGAKLTDLNKQVWTKPEDIIANAVKAHGGNLEDYKRSGLG